MLADRVVVMRRGRAEIQGDHVDLPRPRDRGSPLFDDLRAPRADALAVGLTASYAVWMQDRPPARRLRVTSASRSQPT